MSQLELIEVTDRMGRLQAADWLLRTEPIHRQLRPQLPVDYPDKMQRVFAGGGRLLIAANGDRVCGVAVWRMFENTFVGRQLYVDDLVTDAEQRSHGIGNALLARCEDIARDLDCLALVLDSGVQRSQAHKFYFREGLVVSAFNFSKSLA